MMRRDWLQRSADQGGPFRKWCRENGFEVSPAGGAGDCMFLSLARFMDLEGDGVYDTQWIRYHIVEDLKRDVNQWLRDVDWRFLNERALQANASWYARTPTRGMDAARKLYDFYNAFQSEQPLGGEWDNFDVLASVGNTLPLDYQLAGRDKFTQWVHRQLDLMRRTTTDGNEYILARFCQVYKRRICLMDRRPDTGAVSQRIIGQHGQGTTVSDPRQWLRPRLPDLIGLYYNGHAHYEAFVPTRDGMDRFRAESRHAMCEAARARAYEEYQQRAAGERQREHTARANIKAARTASVDILRPTGHGSGDDELLEAVVRAIEDALRG